MWVLTLVMGAFAAEPQWDQLVTTADWKQVATRTTDQGTVVVSHKEVGTLPCLQGTTTVTLAPDKLLAVAKDIPSATKWTSADLTLSESLGNTSDGKVRYWQYLDIPNWTMVYDRFWILEGTVVSSGAERRFRWNRVPNAASAFPTIVQRAQAIESGAVEPPTNWGEWSFIPKGTTTEVTYRACVDVGGKLPMSIQTWVAQRTLPDTVADLIREAKRRG